MNQILEDIISAWNEQTPEDQEYFKKAGLFTLGQFIAYHVYRRVFNAPRWAAYGIPAILTSIAFEPYKVAYEKRNGKRLV
jgi:hypothetical protein